MTASAEPQPETVAIPACISPAPAPTATNANPITMPATETVLSAASREIPHSAPEAATSAAAAVREMGGGAQGRAGRPRRAAPKRSLCEDFVTDNSGVSSSDDSQHTASSRDWQPGDADPEDSDCSSRKRKVSALEPISFSAHGGKMDPSKLFRNIDIMLHRTGSAASDSDGSLAANVKLRPRLDPSALKPKGMAQGTLSFVVGMSRPVQVVVDHSEDLASGDEGDDETQAMEPSAGCDQGPLYKQRTICFAKAVLLAGIPAAAAAVAVNEVVQNPSSLPETPPVVVGQLLAAANTVLGSVPEDVPSGGDGDAGPGSVVGLMSVHSGRGPSRSRSRKRRTLSVPLPGDPEAQLPARTCRTNDEPVALKAAAEECEQAAAPRDRFRQSTISFRSAQGPAAAATAAGSEAEKLASDLTTNVALPLQSHVKHFQQLAPGDLIIRNDEVSAPSSEQAIKGIQPAAEAITSIAQAVRCAQPQAAEGFTASASADAAPQLVLKPRAVRGGRRKSVREGPVSSSVLIRMATGGEGAAHSDNAAEPAALLAEAVTTAAPRERFKQHTISFVTERPSPVQPGTTALRGDSQAVADSSSAPLAVSVTQPSSAPPASAEAEAARALAVCTPMCKAVGLPGDGLEVCVVKSPGIEAAGNCVDIYSSADRCVSVARSVAKHANETSTSVPAELLRPSQEGIGPDPGRLSTAAVPVDDQSVQPSVGETSKFEAAAVLAGSVATTAAVPVALDAILSPAKTPETQEAAGHDTARPATMSELAAHTADASGTEVASKVEPRKVSAIERMFSDFKRALPLELQKGKDPGSGNLEMPRLVEKVGCVQPTGAITRNILEPSQPATRRRKQAAPAQKHSSLA